MRIMHHPTDETLAAFASATLDEGNSLVVSSHLAHCSACRRTMRTYRDIAAQMIDAQPVMEIGAGTRSRVLEAVASCDQLERPRVESDASPASQALRPVSLYDDGGDWRWIGFGVRWKPISVNAESGTRVFMLKAAPGTRLPDHRHVGTEWTCVLQGAFSHELGRFGPGDFDEADGSVEHSPYVEREGDCVCLVALNGRIELKSWIGRMIQPMVRI